MILYMLAVLLLIAAVLAGLVFLAVWIWGRRFVSSNPPALGIVILGHLAADAPVFVVAFELLHVNRQAAGQDMAETYRLVESAWQAAALASLPCIGLSFVLEGLCRAVRLRAERARDATR